jgi:hypothetical protein
MKSLFTLFFTVFSLVSSAQIERGGFGHFQSGLIGGNFERLKDYMKGIPELNQTSISGGGSLAGGTGYGIVRNILIGGSGLATAHVVSGPNNANITLGFASGMFSIGYIIYAKNKFFIYPYLGVGAGGYNISIENVGSTTIPFANQGKVAANETKNYVLGQSTYDFGISIKGNPSAKKPDRFGGFMLGLELGTLMAVPSANWADEDGEIVNGPPAFGQFNPYLRITIGGGGGKMTSK